MAKTLLRAGRLVVVAFAAYLAAGCATSVQDENPRKTALAGVEAPSQERLAEVQLRVGRAAFDQGSPGTALDLFEKAHNSAPAAAAPLVGKGDALFALRRFGAAEAAYRAAGARDPASFEAQEGLGKTLVTLKKFEDGLRAFEAARAIRTDATLLNKIGVTHELMGNGAAAQEQFRAALALDPTSLTARNNLALSLAVSGSYDAALSEMEKVVTDPKSSERHHANLAFIYGLAGEPMDRAPAKVLRAAANKGWDADFFARTRRVAQSGDRAAILDLLNNRGARMAALPEAQPAMSQLPEMPESTPAAVAPAMAATADAPKAAPVGLIPPPPPAPAPAMAPAAEPTDPTPVGAAEAPVSQDAPAGNIVSPPEQAAETTETAALVVPPPPPAPAEMVRGTPVATPAGQVAMPAPGRAAAAGVTHHVQLGAWPTRWLGRALRRLGPLTADALPDGHVEVVRGARFHTLRSAGIGPLDEARRICGTLRGRSVDCFVTRQATPPAGQDFDLNRAGDPEALSLFLASVEPIAPAADMSAGGTDKTVASLRPAPAGAAKPAGPDTAPMAGAGEYRLQFAAYRRAAHLGRGLQVLRHKAGDLLPAIEKLVRAETPEGTTVPYRLRSAPLESRAAAADLCKSLSEKGVECLVIRHGATAWLPLS